MYAPPREAFGLPLHPATRGSRDKQRPPRGGPGLAGPQLRSVVIRCVHSAFCGRNVFQFRHCGPVTSLGGAAAAVLCAMELPLTVQPLPLLRPMGAQQEPVTAARLAAARLHRDETRTRGGGNYSLIRAEDVFVVQISDTEVASDSLAKPRNCEYVV
ncbi:hypothetical protein Purlil1_1801 [Purpureocillium lilacinum]|uniref:Uncharacterized protein n=1 Tax=Purpureocillium lilacinum TaxID=33203 RepID=A0ABR0CB21_PURLI|nr:hypothetical protein Purlil1_1801 [Purpureocillium lilacinum]